MSQTNQRENVFDGHLICVQVPACEKDVGQSRVQANSETGGAEASGANLPQEGNSNRQSTNRKNKGENELFTKNSSNVPHQLNLHFRRQLLRFKRIIFECQKALIVCWV